MREKMSKPEIVYVIDFPDAKGKFGEDTIVIKAQNFKEVKKVIRYYYADAKEKLKEYRSYCTTLMELKK